MNKKRISLIIFVLAILLLGIILRSAYIYNTYYVNVLSIEGQELLNSYEFPWYLVDVNEENNYCLEPYDVNDGVITFGPGITYNTEEEGLEDINQRFNTSYTKENNCIDVDLLFELQKQILVTYEKHVYNFAFFHRIRLSQNEFDALVLLAYNSPDFIRYDEVSKMLKGPNTKESYIEAINNYYKKLNNYYDNENTKEKNDGFGVGWYNRIVDSAEVFFDNEYEFQNNAIYKLDNL